MVEARRLEGKTNVAAIHNRSKPVKRFRSPIDRWLFRFSVYLVPVALAVLSLVTLLILPNQFTIAERHVLHFQAISDRDASLDPAAALLRLNGTPSLVQYSTHLSEAPVWFRTTSPSLADDDATEVELPSRHAERVACWRASDLRSFGEASHAQGSSGDMRLVKAGFAVNLGRTLVPVEVLCRATFSGPAHLSVEAWRAATLRTSSSDFHASAGMLEGGLLTLSVFVLITALINREWSYVMFAAWLVGNLRLCANTMGWDTQWLDRTIPYEWMSLIRKLTFACYYLVTASLFRQLFRRELKQVGYWWLLRTGQYLGLVMLVAAFALPYRHFIPVLWGIGSFGMGMLIFLLGVILMKTHSRVAMWYSASLGVVLFAILSEVIGAAFDIKALADGLNAVTAALTSSMMAAFAIAEQIRFERAHRRQAQVELRNTYDVTPIGLFTLRADGSFVRANPALREMLELHGVDYAHRRWQDFFEFGAWAKLEAVAAESRDAEVEIRGVPGHGGAANEARHYLIKAIRSNELIEGSLQDITERSHALEQLRFMSEHDPLTGSLNRRGVEKALSRHAIGDVPGRLLSLAYVDLDRFKLVNDLFGHRAGDEVLKQVTQRIQAVVSTQEPIGRVGGDEFIIVFPDTSIEVATGLCHAIIDAIRGAPYQVGNRAFKVEASLGLIEVTAGIRTHDAVSAADRACREAKAGRQDRMVIYGRDASVFRERAEELKLIETLGGDLEPLGLMLHMQPIMSLRAPGQSLNFEVLLRMRGPDGEMIPAAKIIQAAERSGNIAAIDRWVVTTTLEWLQHHRAELPHTRFVCVNLSGGSLNDEQFIEDVFAVLAQFGSLVEMLCFEITEGVALHDLDNTRRFIARVHELGGKIALDDFGAGYTSFNYLKELSADALKIDGAFIKSMASHPANVAIVEAIVALARNLGMRSIAEWVEDYNTLAALAELGVDYVQGYLIAKPMSGELILGACSAAAFIEDAQVAAFVSGNARRRGEPGGDFGGFGNEFQKTGSDLH
jgi:diguanylate cyclase (GGDEF)-like protein